MDEFFVGCLALAISSVATAISIGPWTAPYQIRTFEHLQNRFGKPAARLAWLIIAVVSGASGAAILNGLRPNYAAPDVYSEPPQ